jgi:murein DD-endopeptidase MepM/ murein hydrolase activator NlpD
VLPEDRFMSSENTNARGANVVSLSSWALHGWRALAALGRRARTMRLFAIQPTGVTMVVVVLFLLSGWLTVASVSYFGSRHLLNHSAQHIEDLEEAYAALLAESEASASAYVDQIEGLERTARRQSAMIADLSATWSEMDIRLEVQRRRLETLSAERDRAHQVVGELEAAIARSAGRPHMTAAERADLQVRLETARTLLAEITQQRDQGRRAEIGLRWQLAQLETELDQMRVQREAAQSWLKDWVLGSVEALEQLFVATGIDVEQLISRAAGGDLPPIEVELGQGGPFQVVEVGPLPLTPLLGLPADPIEDNIHRLAALQRLARTLPLASPLDHFYLTSPYGKRRDPFTKQLAYHAGLDFGAARGSEILSTAPGRVLHAGPAGPYGNLVEIDHGMGITTHYGHLASISVVEGEQVAFRQPVGVIGNTGRSTSRHLHYEIRIDGTPHDPAKFLNAGRYLIGIFEVSEAALEHGLIEVDQPR